MRVVVMFADGFPTIDEAIANRRDAAWWFRAFFRIKLLRGREYSSRLEPFVLNWGQREIAAAWLRHCRINALKARQMGISTYGTFEFTRRAMLTPHQNFFLWNISAEHRAQMLKKVRDSFACMPRRWRKIFRVLSDSKTEFVFTCLTGEPSRLFVAETPRSETLTGAQFSEAGFISDRFPVRAQELISAIYAAAPPPCPVIVETTAYSTKGFYYKMWKEDWARQVEGAEKTQNEFYNIFLPWWRKPENTAPIPANFVLEKSFKEQFDIYERRDKIFLSPGQRVWYQGEAQALKNIRLMRREHPTVWEESFESAGEGAFMVEAVDQILAEKRFGVFPAAAGFPLFVYFDIGYDNFTALTFYQHIGGNVHRIVDFYRNRHKQPPHYVNVVWRMMERMNTQRAELILPHDSKHKRYGQIHTVLTQTRNLWQGGTVRVLDRSGIRKRDSESLAIQFAGMVQINETEGTLDLLDCLRKVQWSYDRVRDVYADDGKLEKSSYNDAYDSFELCAMDRMKFHTPDLVRRQFFARRAGVGV